MAKRAISGTPEAGAKIWENPLVPHRRLREMYRNMLGARLLDQWLTAQSPTRRSKKTSAPTRTHGEEACRVSTLLGLEKGDLVIDPTESPLTNYLLGASGRKVAEARSAAKPSSLESGRVGRRLEVGSDTAAALHLAVGAGLALKGGEAQRLLMAFAASDLVDTAAWSAVLRSTARTEASVLFVVLPGKARAGLLSEQSTRLGVPGIAVEADDAVALYRVAQESTVRIRMGGGPVLMECVRLRSPGMDRADPVEAMRQVLLLKGAADEAWADRLGVRLGSRLLGELEAGQSAV